MTLGMVFLSVLMALIVGWLFRQTVHVQPWLAHPAVPGLPSAQVRPAVKTGLWVFLGVASSLFVLVVSASSMRLGLADWSPIPRPRLLMLNTALLAFASLSMEGAKRAGRGGDGGTARRWLLAAGALTAGFVLGQLVVWKQLHDAAFGVSSSAAAAFFYLFTAVHGLHVLGGLVAWARAVSPPWRSADPAVLRGRVDLCATYWHYLLGVWVALYALLVSGGAGLAICSSNPL
ncbi:cytochrome c oxidase subunit 3 [Ramlibacter sp.]